MFDPTKPYQTNYVDPFSGAHNPLNATRGNWSIDPMYTTPGYTANFRPQYAGPQGASAPGNIGFWQGAMSGGLGGTIDVSGQNPLYYNNDVYGRAVVSGTTFGAMDASMSFNQSIAAPIAAFALGEMLTSGRVKAYQDASMVMAGTWTRMTGGTAAEAARAATTRTMSGAIGAKFGRGAMGMMAGLGGQIGGRGYAAGQASMMGRAMTGMGSFAGGVAGRLAVPLMVGHGIMNMIDHNIFDPYIGIREGQNALLQNFSNQYITDGGSRVTGFGLSRERAGRLSSAFAVDSAHDLAFDVSDYGKIADYASRAGMFNDMSNFDVDSMKRRVKGLASQVKMVMSIASEPSLQEAVQMLAKLKQSGATDVGGFAGSLLNTIGSNAATSGISAMQMMNTVGATGQYMYQSQGLTPFIGIREASGMHAGFASAFRNGLIDPAAIARMGGIEGATQSAMSASVALGKTNYNMMGLANKYLFGGKGSSTMEGTIGAFGANMSANPLSTMGLMNLFGNEMVSKQLADSPTDVFTQLFQRRNQMGLGRDAGTLATIASSFGLSNDQTLAMIEQLRAAGDDAAFGYRTGAGRGQMRRQLMNIIEQQNMDYHSSPLATPVHAWRNLSSGTQAWFTKQMGRLTSSVSAAGDDMDEFLFGQKYGATAKYFKSTSDHYSTSNILGAPRTADKVLGFATEGIDDLLATNPTFTDALSAISLKGGMSGWNESYETGASNLQDLYGGFFTAINGTRKGTGLAKAIQSGDERAIRSAVAVLSKKDIGAIGGDATGASKRSRLLEYALSGKFDKLLKNDITDVETGTILGAAQRMYKRTLGTAASSDFFANAALTNDVFALASNPDLMDSMTLDGGTFSEYGNQVLGRLTGAGVISASDLKGLSVGQQAELMKSKISNLALAMNANHAGVYSSAFSGIGSMDSAIAEFKKAGHGQLGMFINQLSADQKKMLRGASDAELRSMLPKFLAAGADKLGFSPTSVADKSLSMINNENAQVALEQSLGVKTGIIDNKRKMALLRDASTQVDFRQFETIRKSLELDIASKNVESSETLAKAANTFADAVAKETDGAILDSDYMSARKKNASSIHYVRDEG